MYIFLVYKCTIFLLRFHSYIIYLDILILNHFDYNMILSARFIIFHSYLSKHKMSLRRFLDIHNVQKTSEKHFRVFTLSEHKIFLSRLLDIHSVQKTFLKHLVFLLSVNTRSFCHVFWTFIAYKRRF